MRLLGIFILLTLSISIQGQTSDANAKSDNHEHIEEKFDYVKNNAVRTRLKQLFELKFNELGLSINKYQSFFEFIQVDAKEFIHSIEESVNKSKGVNLNLLDSVFVQNEELLKIKYARFIEGVQPNDDYIHLEGNEVGLRNNKDDSHLPIMAPNGPCENTDFGDGTTTGWIGTYGTTTHDIDGPDKTCSGIFDSYDANNDECCPLFGGCSPWTPADGYVQLSVNNATQNTGFNSGAVNTSANAITPGVHTIMTGGFDPLVPGNALTVTPPSGSNSLRLGYGKSGYNAQTASQTFLVSDANKNFIYHFAAIINDPGSGHADYQLPYLKIRMFDENGDTISCASLDVTSATALQVGGFVQATATDGEVIYWKDWTSITVPLNPYMGQNVTIEFTTSNCAQSGHYGYAYISANCSPQQILASSPTICGGETVTLTAPPGLSTYTWSGPGIVSGQGTPTIVVDQPGGYQVDMTTLTTAPFVPCTFSIDTVIDGSPIVPIAAFSSTTVCLGDTTEFLDLSQPTASITGWNWDFDNNGTIDDTLQNPNFVFPSSGTFPVALTAYSGGCNHDTIINVIVNQGPTAVFNSDSVCLGEATTFTDASIGGVNTWNWDFDANATIDNSTQNPTYTFPNSGTFPVQLSVADVSGNCGHDTIVNVVVHPKPLADFTVNDTCLTLANQFNDNSNVSLGTITGWDWDFDNNGTIDNSTQNPTNIYGTSGTQTIELVVTANNTCKDTITKTVEIFDNPVADFVSDTVCEPFASTMTDETVLGSIGIANWDWDFDANATIDNTLQNPTNTFGVAGSYPVTLNVTDSNGCVSSVTENVIVASKPTAAFNFSDVCFGAATNFTDLSNGNGGTIDSWAWDFTGNGTVDDTTQNPSHGYASAGNNTVELLVETSAGCKDDTTLLVDVDAIPEANFGVAPVCFGNVSMFYDSSIVSNSNIVQWSWDFESDATIDVNTQNPTYTYPTAGLFNATLTVVSDSGCISSIVVPVGVSPNPIANFTTDTACSSLATSFTDATTLGLVGIETWEWDFDNDATVDDGNQNPTFTFAGAGNYTVGLNVIDSIGCSHDTTLAVTVSENPIAGFTFSDECYGDLTSFTDQSLDNGGTTAIDSWEWDFDGDGVIDDNTNTLNPTNMFDSAGTYTTQLIVTSILGCMDTAYVSVDVDAVPVANFGGTNECLGSVTTFTDSSSVTNGNVNQWSWDFGDASPIDNNQNPIHQYTSPGIKNVTLTVATDSGCTHIYNTSVEVFVNPIANFTTDTACSLLATSFTDVTALGNTEIETWEWDFDNDATVDDGIQNPTYTFAGAGNYTVGLNVIDSVGCSHDTTLVVTVSENPIAGFTFSDECYGDLTSFTDQSLDNGGTTAIDSWEWDFDGDGVIDDNTNTPNPTNMFDSAGVYTTQLIITSTLGCMDTAYVSVDVDAVPVANFGLEDVCLNTEGTFYDSTTVALGNINQWDWNFGDGTGTSVLQNPSYTYATPGIKNVTLTVYSDSGCTHNVTLPVEVYPNPTANFDTTDVCLNVAAQFTDQSNGNGGTIDSWEWDFDNNGSVDNTNQNPSYNYPSDGTYNVELIVSTISGCKDTLQKTVTIYPMPTADFTFINSCFMDSVEFTDNSNVSSGVINQWQWDLNDGQSSGLQNPRVYYSGEGAYDVELIVITDNNCADTISKSGIEVWPLPVVNFGPTAVCINYATQFNDSSSVSNTYTANSNVQWNWDFGNGIGSSFDQNPIYTYPNDGVYIATLTVTTDNNCVDSISKPVTVHPQPVVDFVADSLAGCTPVNSTFTNLSTLNGGDISTSTWEWDFNGDGNSDSPNQHPEWQFTNPSNSSVQEYDVSLTVTSEFGCVDSITKTNYISSYPIPLASFMFYPDDDASIVDSEIEFTDHSIIASSWQWDLGDGTQTTVVNPIHEYADTGFYWTTLVIENVYGCADSTAKLVRINPIYAIWIPNAFTPDGDFLNDYFYVDGYGIKELEVQIFDRWGIKVYEDIGIDQSWDGFYKGERVPLDVYVYKVRAKDVFDEWHDYIGKVTVVE